MEKTHILKNPNKNYLGNWDLPEKGDLILTIKSAKWEMVKNPVNNKETEKRVIRFTQNVKPLICNETNARAIMKATGKEWLEDLTGSQITLYKADYFDKKAKEDIKVVRVRTLQVEKKEMKPVLTKNSEKYQKAKEFLQNGGTIEAITKSYEVSKQLINELCNL